MELLKKYKDNMIAMEHSLEKKCSGGFILSICWKRNAALQPKKSIRWKRNAVLQPKKSIC